MRLFKQIFMFLLALAIIAVGGGYALIVYAEPVDLLNPAIIVDATHGKAEYKISGEEYKEAYYGVELSAGDTLRTGEDSRAKLILWDTTEVELDSETELYIRGAHLDASNYLKQQIRLELLKGRIWVRTMGFAHEESYISIIVDDYSVKAMGTSFEVKKNFNVISGTVYENMVAIARWAEPENFISVFEGSGWQMVQGDPVVEKKENTEDDNETNEIEEVPQVEPLEEVVRIIDKTSIMISDWYKENNEADELFADKLKDKRADILKQAEPLPGDAMYRLKRWGEELALKTAQIEVEKKKLKQKIELTRALEAEALYEQGRIDEAHAHLQEYPIGDKTRNMIKRLQTFDPKYKKEVGVLDGMLDKYLDKFWGESESEFINSQIEKVKNIDLGNFQDAISKTWEQITNLIPDSAKEYAGEKYDEAKESLENLTEESESPPQESPKSEQDKLSEPALEMTETDDYDLSVSDLRIDLARENLSPGDSLELHCYAVMSGGEEVEVSDRADWSVGTDHLTGESVGNVSQNYFTANERGGKATISAEYLDLRAERDVTVLVMRDE